MKQIFSIEPSAHDGELQNLSLSLFRPQRGTDYRPAEEENDCAAAAAQSQTVTEKESVTGIEQLFSVSFFFLTDPYQKNEKPIPRLMDGMEMNYPTRTKGSEPFPCRANKETTWSYKHETSASQVKNTLK